MNISNIKHLIKLLEERGVTDEFDLKFTANTSDCAQCFNIEEFILDDTNNDYQRFDIGHSDKLVNIFLIPR